MLSQSPRHVHAMSLWKSFVRIIARHVTAHRQKALKDSRREMTVHALLCLIIRTFIALLQAIHAEDEVKDCEKT